MDYSIPTCAGNHINFFFNSSIYFKQLQRALRNHDHGQETHVHP